MKWKEKFNEQISKVSLSHDLFKSLFPTQSFNVGEKEPLKRREIISISDGDNGTLTMKAKDFQK